MTASTATESLRDRIKRIMDVSAASDPKVIAEEVLATVTTGEAVELLNECLPPYVRHVVQTAGKQTAPSAGPGRSWKVAAAKAYAEKLLRRRVDVAGDGTGWKFLAECDAEDLASVAALRRKQAEELVETAAWFEKIAGLLAEHESETVNDLPEPVLVSLATNGEVTS